MIEKIKNLLTKHISLLIVVLPLITLLFYGLAITNIIEYEQEQYAKEEITRYEAILKQVEKDSLRDKAKHISSFVDFFHLDVVRNRAYALDDAQLQSIIEEKFLTYIESIKRYDSGFIFILKPDASLIQHPCADNFTNIDAQENKLLDAFIYASQIDKFVYYTGKDCKSDSHIKKIAYVRYVEELDWYIVINKNIRDIDSLIEKKREEWKNKIDNETTLNYYLLIVISIFSIVLSVILSKFLNHLILKYQAEIEKSNEALFYQSRLAQAGELLNIIAHQWRHPISKISMLVTNLRFGLYDDELDKEALDKEYEEIEEITEFLSQTIDDFHQFYKPNKTKTKVHMVEVVNRAIGFLEASIANKDIEIVKECSEDIELSLYPNEVMQVFINIIQNAIELSETKSKIEISTEVYAANIVVRIKDYAGGIKPENIDKIFEANFSTKSKDKNSNLGLGLYVCKNIMEKHMKGQILVESEGISTTFSLIFPKD